MLRIAVNFMTPKTPAGLSACSGHVNGRSRRPVASILTMTQLMRSKLPPRAIAPDRAGACANKAGRPAASRRRVVGLLGGSFNPAHAGHRHISLIALKRLRLDEIWWLVSPQNPLKRTRGMAPFAERLAGARAVAQHPRIRVTGIEADLGTTYTAETLARLARRLPHLRFIWLMGADNLAQVHQWKDWQQIFHTVAVAVFARPSYCLRALASTAAHRFARNRVPESASGTVRRRSAPAWVFLVGPLSPLSATAIRARRRSPRSDRASGSQRTAGVGATPRG
jgi:nicotinate-nucleotide adenylyltransferase